MMDPIGPVVLGKAGTRISLATITLDQDGHFLQVHNGTDSLEIPVSHEGLLDLCIAIAAALPKMVDEAHRLRGLCGPDESAFPPPTEDLLQ